MAQLVTEVKAKYLSQQMNGTKLWPDLNINIKTAVFEVIK